jgi:hypothetical protein
VLLLWCALLSEPVVTLCVCPSPDRPNCRENQKVEQQLSSLIPLVNEVNQMAEEMQKTVRFEAKLVIKPTATINFSTLDEIQHLKKVGAAY